MRKVLFMVAAGLIMLSLILTACSGPTTTTPASTAPPKTSAPTTAATSAPATTAPASSTTAPATTTSAAAGKSITIKAVTFLPKNIFSIRNIYDFVDQAPKQTNGTVTVQYLGGPEVMPALNQAESVRQGTVQMAIVPIELYDGLVPLANMTALSLLEPEQEHANGYWDYLNQLHQKAGLYFLERGTDMHIPVNFTLIVNKAITKPGDLTGMKIGCSSNLVQPYLQFIKATPVQVANTDAYTGLERGVIEGMVDPIQNHVTFQLYTVCKYFVEPSFYRGSVAVIFNLATWNSLSPDQQKALAKIGADSLKKYEDDVAVEITKAKQTCTDKGMKAINFSDADKAQFTKDLYDTAWAAAAIKYPDVTAKIKPLSSLPAK